MGLFEQFPYTNFHELNLDWLLRIVKRLEKLSGKDLEDAIIQTLMQLIESGRMADLLEALALNGRVVTSKYFEPAPLMPDHYTVFPDLTTLKSEDIYTYYDNLMTIDGFNKVAWGVDEDGLELSYYTWTCDAARKSIYTAEGESAGERTYTRPLADTSNALIIFSGLHGNEKANIWALYHMIRAILAGENPLFDYIRHNVNILIAPCVNPWGVDHNSRDNKNGVDLNRNFPYKWAEYVPPAGTNKGSAAASEKGVQMVIDIFTDNNTRQNHNGTVILDSHDFQGAAGSIYEGRYYVAAATEPELRINLEKAAMQMLKFYEAVYPGVIADAEHPVRVTNLTPDVPTLENWTYHLGFRYTMLQECRTKLNGAQYDTASHNVVWQTLGLALSAAIDFIGHSKQLYINTISDIGCSTADSLADIVAAMPPRSEILIPVFSGSGIYDDMPAAANGVLKIESGNWDSIEAMRLVYQTFSASASETWSAAVYGDGDHNITISNWQLLSNVE